MAQGTDDTEALLAGEGADELWLISYADLLTLLIGFFVMLLAVSPMKAASFERLAASLNGEQQAPLEVLKEQVDQFIERQGLQDQVRTVQDLDALRIEFKDALLFDSGSADIRAQGQTALREFAGLLKTLPKRPVVIEGHTDDRPISNARFASNWELSAQRAINVRATLEAGGAAREQMSVRGFADTRSAEVGQGLDVEAQRAANRRVVIRVE